MNRLVVFLTVVTFPVVAQQERGPQAQQSQAGAGAAQATPGGRGGPRATNARTNEQTGVDIDRFIGDAKNSPVHLSHATLLTHSILTAGDAYQPGAAGAVLEYRKGVETATLLGHNRTPLLTLEDQFLFYVQSGEGRLDDGKQFWDLREGLAILIPPNSPRRFVNTSDKPLEMIMIRWTAAGTPKKDIIVRDANLLSYCEENAHWNNTSKCVFGVNDGLMQSERVLLVMLRPWAMSQPHTHPPGFEEIWTKITPGTAIMVLGSEMREFPQNAGYRVPPTGITEHANINLSKDKSEWWLYMARGRGNEGQQISQAGGNATAAAASASAGAGSAPAAVATIPGNAPPQRGGGGRNPNIIRDQASTEAANVAGKPLK